MARLLPKDFLPAILGDRAAEQVPDVEARTAQVGAIIRAAKAGTEGATLVGVRSFLRAARVYALQRGKSLDEVDVFLFPMSASLAFELVSIEESRGKALSQWAVGCARR